MKAIFGHLGMMALVYLTLSLPAAAQFTYITNADNTITITDYTGSTASVSIPSNFNGRTVTRLGDESFRDSLAMTTVVIPGGVTNMGVRAFYTCTKLASVALPNSVTRLGNMAFMDCNSMSNLSLGNGIASIEDETFRNCTNLLSVAIPNSVASIGANAFRGCLRMTNLTIGTGVKILYDSAYGDCDALRNLSIPGNVTNTGYRAFSYCSALQNVIIENGVKTIGEWSFLSCEALTNVTIGSSVTKIDNGAFTQCSNLRDTTIPSSVTVIGGTSFAYCGSLKNVAIPNSVVGLGGGAFQFCSGLTNLTIGTGMSVLSNNVFEACAGLKNISIPNNVRNIQDYAFMSCSGLTNVFVGSGVTNIGQSVFNGCGNLLGIYFSGNAPSYGLYVFDGCINATVYRMASATGWPTVPNLWAGRPTELWSTTALAINPSSTNLSNAAASGKTIGVTANVSWTAATNASWLAITAGASGTTNGIVTFSVTTNSAASRTGRIVVAGGGISLTCTVTQAGLSAPSAPTGISATDGTSTNQVQVSWSASSGATGYEVWRFTNSNPILASRIAQRIPGSPYNDTNVTVGLVYFYWLKATNAGGASALSSSNSGYAQLAPPLAPTGVAATKGSYTNKIRVTWSASSGATGYEVWRHTSNNSNSSIRIVQGIGGSPYDDISVIAGTNYYYWVKATNAGGASAFSLSDSGYASNAIPSAPTGVLASDNYSDRIRVTWTNSSGATGYEVWRNTNNVSGSATKIAQNIASSPYDDLTPPQGITYYYWVKATNTSGASAFSTSDSGLRASTSFAVSGTVSYGGSQTGNIFIIASPHIVANSNIALSLDGVDDGVVVDPPTQVMQLNTQMTMCAWVNVTGSLAGSLATILLKYETSTNRVAYLFALNSSDGRPYASFGDGYNFYAPPNVGMTSGWTHIAFTHNGTVGKWYVNGQFSSQTTNGSVHRFGDGPLYFGRCSDLQNYYYRFPGQLDDIGLWSRTLSQGEIQGVMTNGMVGTEPGLVSCWNFDDGTANDLTTNANHGQFMAGASTTSRSATGPSYSTTLVSPNGYLMTNVLAGEYDIRAYRDSNGNGNTEPWEAYGTYPASPLAVTGNMANINITLQDPATDTDGDGVSDYDEIYMHGSSWTNSDTDADGMYDGDEVLAGSSPTNGDSMFGFADSQPVPEGGGVVVSWPSLSNRVYRLERTTNLLMDFEPLVNDLPADPPVNSYTDDTPNVLGAYKVGVRME